MKKSFRETVEHLLSDTESDIKRLVNLEVRKIRAKFREREAKLQKQHKAYLDKLRDKIESLKEERDRALSDALAAEEHAMQACIDLANGQEYARYLGRELEKLKPRPVIGPNLYLTSENHKELREECQRN